MKAGNPVMESQSHLLSLIQRAASLLERDRSEAWRCLRDASTLLSQETSDEPIAGHVAQPAQPVRPGCLAAWQTRRVVDHIEGHLGAKLSIEDIAATIGLSKSHFCRAFKSTLGTSPMTYVAARRIERAQRIMRTSAETLADVALSCGFADQSHLNRHFRRVVGVTPGQWRRSSEQAPAAMETAGRSGSCQARPWRPTSQVAVGSLAV
jgi:AraC family transcriptional regulator